MITVEQNGGLQHLVLGGKKMAEEFNVANPSKILTISVKI